MTSVRLYGADRRGNCLHDMKQLALPLRVTANPVYLRFHSAAGHSGDYQLPALEAWAERIRGWQSEGLDVYFYFNNDRGEFALEDAQTLKQLLGLA